MYAHSHNLPVRHLKYVVRVDVSGVKHVAEQYKCQRMRTVRHLRRGLCYLQDRSVWRMIGSMQLSDIKMNDQK